VRHGHHVNGEGFPYPFQAVIAEGGKGLVDGGSGIRIVDIDGQGRLMEEGFLMAVKDRLLADAQGASKAQANAANRGFARRPEDLNRLFRGIGALGNFRLLGRQFHGKGHAGAGPAFLAIGLRQQFLNL